jgi:plasmid stability protein
MSKMIQIRHVPEDVHRTLKARAAEAGQSLSEYLLAELSRLAGKPTLKELWARIDAREPVEIEVSSAELIRDERERRR